MLDNLEEMIATIERASNQILSKIGGPVECLFMLGTGLGGLVIDSQSAAPESVKKWKLEYNRTGSEDGGFVTMAHEEEIVI